MEDVGSVITSQVEKSFGNLIWPILSLVAIAGISYLIIFLILRLINFPKQLAKLLAGLTFLGVIYYMFINNFIPTLQSTL
ncbi:hypothetical protein [Metabacillus fastidiosus]|uniref:hypothetical protein n=1 Tax=Metabacillus fastidiosus TaxID=1458 RepID=UPI002E1EA9AC|nr:hypothetical protein [Metabacillus fastidiosus]